MHTVTINSTPYQLPSRWDELSGEQLRKMAWVSLLDKSPADTAKLMILIMAMSLPWWARLKFQYFYIVQSSIEEKADLLYLTRSFQEFRTLTTQKIQKIRYRFVLLYGPESGLANATFWEYIKAEQYFLNYNERKDPIWLDKLVAVLYRPQREGFNPQIHADIRTPLNDASVKFRTAIVQKIDLQTKLAILMWFDGCRTALIKMFPLIFQKEEKSRTNFNKSRGQSGWIGLISELAGSMNDYEKIGETNLFTAMTDISHRIRKANESASKKRK